MVTKVSESANEEHCKVQNKSCQHWPSYCADNLAKVLHQFPCLAVQVDHVFGSKWLITQLNRLGFLRRV